MRVRRGHLQEVHIRMRVRGVDRSPTWAYEMVAPLVAVKVVRKVDTSEILSALWRVDPRVVLVRWWADETVAWMAAWLVV